MALPGAPPWLARRLNAGAHTCVGEVVLISLQPTATAAVVRECVCAIGTKRDTERPRKRGAETQTEGGFRVRYHFLFLTGNLKT